MLTIGVLIIVGHFLNSSEFWVMYRAVGVPIGFFENWMVFTAGLLGNLLPGQVGTMYKFRYMKTVYDLPYAKSGSNYGANLVISLGSSSIVGILGIVVFATRGGDFALTMFIVFITLGVACFALLRFPLPNWRILKGKPARFAESFNEGWHEIQRTPSTAVQVIVIDIVKYTLTAWRFQMAFGLLGVHESFWFFLVVAPAAAIAGIIAFTPGALGFRELFVTAAAVGMGAATAAVIAPAIFDFGWNKRPLPAVFSATFAEESTLPPRRAMIALRNASRAWPPSAPYARRPTISNPSESNKRSRSMAS